MSDHVHDGTSHVVERRYAVANSDDDLPIGEGARELNVRDGDLGHDLIAVRLHPVAREQRSSPKLVFAHLLLVYLLQL